MRLSLAVALVAALLVGGCARRSAYRPAPEVAWPGQSTAGKGWSNPKAGHAPRPVSMESPFDGDEESADEKTVEAAVETDEPSAEGTEEASGDGEDYGDAEDSGDSDSVESIDVAPEPEWDDPIDDEPDEDWDDEGEWDAS